MIGAMIKKPIIDAKVLQQLDQVGPDELELFLLNRGNYRGALLSATRMINEMRVNHNYGVLETLICGHAYLAAGLISAGLKGQDRVGIEMDCDGPAGGFVVDSSAGGSVRGYLRNSPIPVDTAPESFDTRPFIGDGTLSVTRFAEGSKQPFTGHISLAYGTVAQDLANYYLQSEQTPTAFHLSVQFDTEGTVIGAAGLLVQAFPGADEDIGKQLDTRIRNLPSLGGLIANGADSSSIIHEHFQEFEAAEVGTREVRFDCGCSKDRFARFLAAMPIDEIKEIRDQGPFPLRTVCHNCNTTYEFSASDIERAYQMSR